MPDRMTRRRVLGMGAAGSALLLGGLARASPAQSAAWNPGPLAHLVPAASHERFLIKASFHSPAAAPPNLMIDDRMVPGVMADAAGRFWSFDVPGLRPATTHELRLILAPGEPLTDPWPLRTFPAPDAKVDQLRILAFTCAGGYDGPPLKGKTFFLDMVARRRLLARGLSYSPDAVIANGDHIYADLKTAQNKPFAQFLRDHYWSRFGGEIDVSVPMLHPRNAGIFLAACDYQIANLYGTMLRSTPAFFLQDDHDMFENDEFNRNIATLPPDRYGTMGAEETQRLYYPEFLPDANRPAWLPGTGLPRRAAGVNGSFGTLRFGTLLEVILYDCRRHVNYKGAQAQVLPQWCEDWIVRRTLAENTTHFLHVPSLPFAYSSGKLGDWYPDVRDGDTGRLTVDRPKDGWQPGWFSQHQRLIQALAAQKQRAPAVIEGDLHASAAGMMSRSGDLDLRHNPLHVAVTGTLGTGDLLFPSAVRQVESAPSRLVGVDQELPPSEKNGFTIIDVTPDTMIFRLFAWRPPQPVDLIDAMEPVAVHEVPRGG